MTLVWHVSSSKYSMMSKYRDLDVPKILESKEKFVLVLHLLRLTLFCNENLIWSCYCNDLAIIESGPTKQCKTSNTISIMKW